MVGSFLRFIHLIHQILVTLFDFCCDIVPQDKKWCPVSVSNPEVSRSHSGADVAPCLRVCTLVFDAVGVKYWFFVTLSKFLTSLCLCFLPCNM